MYNMQSATITSSFVFRLNIISSKLDDINQKKAQTSGFSSAYFATQSYLVVHRALRTEKGVEPI